MVKVKEITSADIIANIQSLKGLQSSGIELPEGTLEQLNNKLIHTLKREEVNRVLELNNSSYRFRESGGDVLMGESKIRNIISNFQSLKDIKLVIDYYLSL